MRTVLGEETGTITGEETSVSSMGVVIVFQDPLTRQWATEAWERTNEILCQEGGSLRFWRMDDLVHPLIAEEAILAAAEAAIIMVAMRDAVLPPAAQCVWNDGWLAKRDSLTGLLVSMVGVHPHSKREKPLLDDYLRAIAMRGGLDYLPRERTLPAETVSAFDEESIADRANANTQVMGTILRQGRFTASYQHWGINE
jgi:hypothetical protein